MKNSEISPNSSDTYKDFAEFYDIYAGNKLDDLPFYLDYAAIISTPVLEIGAGSGRLTIPLGQAGVSVVATDVSASMLAILKSHLNQESPEVQQRINIVQADACQLNLATRHDLIIVPFYTFNYFLTPQAQNAALQSLCLHLTANGYLLIDVFVPWQRLKNCPTEPVLRVETLDKQTGNRVRGWNIYTIDKPRQIETRKHIFEITQPNGSATKKQFTTQRHYCFPSELEKLFSDNGFAIEHVFTGYAKQQAHAKSNQMLYVLKPK